MSVSAANFGHQVNVSSHLAARNFRSSLPIKPRIREKSHSKRAQKSARRIQRPAPRAPGCNGRSPCAHTTELWVVNPQS